MSEGVGLGLGKLILCGEHAVVYGHPALAFAVDRGTEVTLRERPGPRTVVPQIGDPRLDRALDCVVPARDVEVRISTTLPVGRGMGSSAALAVALVRASASLAGKTLTAQEAFDAALPVERVFHGNPSGLDVAVAAHGGFLGYRRTDPPTLEPISARVPWSVVVLDTGIAGDTASLVAGVAALGESGRRALARIGALVEQARTELANPRVLGELLSDNQRLLKSIGVSSPEVERLVDLAIEAGALGAKLSGAGGGGVVIALVEDPAPVLAAARRAGVDAFPCTVGATR